jgi:hypothetical protein
MDGLGISARRWRRDKEEAAGKALFLYCQKTRAGIIELSRLRAENPMLTGGCACGAIRFRLEVSPYDTGWCHCHICQRLSGSAGMVFTTVAKSAYRIERGAARLGRYQSTSFGERTFCLECGTPLTIHVTHQPNEIDLTVGSLDHPEAVTPGFHLFVAQAPAWLVIADDLPRFSALRPNTRGLAPGETDISEPSA